MDDPIETLLTGVNAGFVADLYDRFLADPESVDERWKAIFTDLAPDGRLQRGVDGRAVRRPPSTNGQSASLKRGSGARAAAVPPTAAAGSEDASASVRARLLIEAYRAMGHLAADFDPLELHPPRPHPDLDPESYGFSEAELDTPVYLGRHDGIGALETATPREILSILREAYCSTVGVEYQHLPEREARDWIRENVEDTGWRERLPPSDRVETFRELARAEGFETFLHTKYPATKRFGLDGGESVIPGVERILQTASELGIDEVVIGMPHRGRLNVLARTLGKEHSAIFAEFQGAPSTPEEVQGSGDVKYHLGASADREFDGRPMHLSLTANPSHLEAVNPVVLGKVRAKQAQKHDEARERVMGLLLHGDAAFAGQGIVPESLDLSQLRGYRTGGTVHVIVNNQIGFTTNPVASRSTPYATDIAKGLQAPIFHVNGDDPEAVVRVAELAVRFRQRFKRDVVIDVFCYRRHGHNEADEPMFTQPRMYTAIADHPTTREIYRERLIEAGVFSEADADRIQSEVREHLESEFEAAGSYEPDEADWLEGRWKEISQLIGEEERHDDPTAVDLDTLREVGLRVTRAPDDIAVNSKLVRILDRRRKMVESDEGVDWATAEALAFGTLLVEGTHVRLSGQDSARGTFSHRHAAIVDQEDDRRRFPLSEIAPGEQATFEVMDSPLSEFGVLGFEYGYSLAEPHALVIWEAQFGDFANTAQVMFDQFITSGESKWLRMCGLVVLLPHGYEGQGPEHSSGRVERFLQQCAEDNMQVVNCTTPANFFHVLRRQVRRNFRKPLVVMTPKSLLRHRLVVSPLADMGPGTGFRRVLGEVDPIDEGERVRRVVLCSGKVYYDLLERRRELEIRDVAVIRVEQLYPWPRDGITRELARYPDAEVVWCQEEPANMGAWNFVMRRLEYILEDEEPGSRPTCRTIYVGRPGAASPATGHLHVHRKEQERLVEQALTWDAGELRRPFERISED